MSTTKEILDDMANGTEEMEFDEDDKLLAEKINNSIIFVEPEPPEIPWKSHVMVNQWNRYMSVWVEDLEMGSNRDMLLYQDCRTNSL